MLEAAGGEGGGAADALSPADLQATVRAALSRLAGAGVSQDLLARLGATQFDIVNLGPGILGETFATANRVLIDPTAAGHGWFADPPEPDRDGAFAPGPDGTLTAVPGSGAAGHEDLLTVVLHEMGHIAGLPDLPGGTGDLMSAFLGDGTRLTHALDRVFAERDG
jgi:hypothetical protein